MTAEVMLKAKGTGKLLQTTSIYWIFAVKMNAVACWYA